MRVWMRPRASVCVRLCLCVRACVCASACVCALVYVRMSAREQASVFSRSIELRQQEDLLLFLLKYASAKSSSPSLTMQ